MIVSIRPHSGKQPPQPLHISVLGNKNDSAAVSGNCSNLLSPEIKLCSLALPSFRLGASLLSPKNEASI